MIAWEKCAEANERTGNDWHAGKHLEQCAQLARDLALHDQVVAYAERACAAYVSAAPPGEFGTPGPTTSVDAVKGTATVASAMGEPRGRL